jgi:hypothetical protein
MNRYVSKAIRDLEFVYDMETKNFATNLVSQNRIPTNRRFDVGGVPYDIRSLRNLLNSGIDRVPHDPGKKLNRAAIDAAMPPTLTSVEAIVPEPSRNNGPPFSSNGLPFSATPDANRMSIVISLEDDDHYQTYVADDNGTTTTLYDERAEWTLPLWKRMADRWASIAAAETMPLRLKKTRRQNRETAIAKMLVDKINEAEATRVLDAVRRAYLRGGGRAMPTLRLVSKKDGSWTVEHPAFRISVFKEGGGVVWWKTSDAAGIRWGSILLVWYAVKKVFDIDRLHLSDEVSGNSHPLNEFARFLV